ncbi:hypothetical protein AUEXF2481DRAFT_402995 [Aureobasidium subglaciale EXF-2481]|uniref:F-box domain-containing protein n=1 Tax=Aureobasidium subglaciale (strain EXF-2481) TaxID=1043005 RepID=A0A074YYC7_AURSE|nr:uncharacterized protein AUEXF2481DRAFT_402995 [Aureobasidium subglaciale EXF-2481]KEQ99172.1 hypothetical protein AUEXF2481DRAFT_402995 [Aureobasidium subglaciale EXF-2481]
MAQHTTGLGDLPTEILLAITEHISHHDITSLRLTCRRLWYSQLLSRIRSHWIIINHPDLDTEIHKPEHILYRLEKSLPNHSLCEACMKFHPNRTIFTPKVTNHWKKYRPCSRGVGSWLHFKNWIFHLQYADVQAVMHRHRWGVTHGAPLNSISINTDWKLTRRPNPLFDSLTRLEINPYIEENMVLRQSCQHVLFRHEDLKVIKSGNCNITHTAIHFFHGCIHTPKPLPNATRHSSIFHDRLRCAMTALIETLILSTIATTFSWRHFDECEFCTCQFSLHIHAHTLDREGFVEIILESWTNLGNCRTPHSSGWKMAAWHAPDNTRMRSSYMSAGEKVKQNIGVPRTGDRDLTRGRGCESGIGHASLSVEVERWRKTRAK